MRDYILIALAAAVCGRPATGEPVTRHHMASHLGDLRDIERMLLAGQLDDARTRAFLLTRQPSDDALSQAVEDAAAALVQAPTIPDAIRLEAKVAAACAGCHVQSPRPLLAPVAPEAPPPTPSLKTRMARHQWAADRLWEGVVLGDERRWRQGLEVLAMRPVAMPKGDGLARRLQAQAIDALGAFEQRSDTYATRAQAYGEMLVTCAACHREQR